MALKQFGFALAAWALLSSSATAELPKIEGLKKEPIYRTSPKYCLLVFGPDAAARVWLVLDGDRLYVDRNGNGDLTEPGEKIAARVDKRRDPEEFGYKFDVGDVAVGGKVHKKLTVFVLPLKVLGSYPALANFASVQAALKVDPKAQAAAISVEVESARLKGSSDGGRLAFQAGYYDEHGPLLFADEPKKAPVVRLDGPLSITFYGPLPKLRLGRENELILAVGTPGQGPGTLAMLAYEGTIPEKAYPRVDIQSEAAPIRENFDLKERC